MIWSYSVKIGVVTQVQHSTSCVVFQEIAACFGSTQSACVAHASIARTCTGCLKKQIRFLANAFKNPFLKTAMSFQTICACFLQSRSRGLAIQLHQPLTALHWVAKFAVRWKLKTSKSLCFGVHCQRLKWHVIHLMNAA